MKFVAQAGKAFFGAAAAFGTGLVTVLVDNTSISQLTDGQWVTVSLGALIAFGGVYGWTNKP